MPNYEEPMIIDPYWFIKSYHFFRKRLQEFFLNWRYMEHIWHDWELFKREYELFRSDIEQLWSTYHYYKGKAAGSG